MASLLVACSERRNSPPNEMGDAFSAGGGSSSSGSDTGGGQAGSNGLTLTGEASFRANENPAAPLVGIFALETNLPCSGTLEIHGGGEDWVLPLEPAAEAHRKNVLGFQPNPEYEVVARVNHDDAELVTEPLSWKTPMLPNDFPRLELVESEPSRMEPGMTIFDERLHDYLVVVDAEGRVRWFYRTSDIPTGHQLLASGRLIFMAQTYEIIEIDWLGNVTARWHAAEATDFSPQAGSVGVDVVSFHHSVDEMPNGNLLTLAHEFRIVEDYPTSSTDPDAATTTVEVRGDSIVEFTREGEIAKEISMFDILDPTRVGHDSVGPGVPEWAHCNSATYDPDSDAYIVSCRHQDAVFKVDRASESLVWILGDHANWRAPWSDLLLTPTGDDFEWAYHHHAAEVVKGGISLFDNGNYRAPAFQEPEPEVFSRAVRYGIDEDAMTVSQAFAYWPLVGGSRTWANAMGDADLQPETENTLIVSGTLQTDGSPSTVWGQLLEVTDDGTPVFELNVSAGPGDPQVNTSTFEADRIPDIRFMSSE